MGAYTCPPTIKTSDPRTPDSHESVAFRHAVAAINDELTLAKIGKPEEFKAWFQDWLPKRQDEARSLGKQFILLKHPLNAMLLQEINQVCQPKMVLVTRPFAEIEKTRLRRGWAQNYGAFGANKIYSAAITNFIEGRINFISVDFKTFLNSRSERAKILDYCEIWPSDEEWDQAEKWLK